MNSYLKALVAAAVPLVLYLFNLVDGGIYDRGELAQLIVALGVAVLVYVAPNVPELAVGALKAVIAAAVPLLLIVAEYVVGGSSFDVTELSFMLQALITAVLVYFVPNHAVRRKRSSANSHV